MHEYAGELEQIELAQADEVTASVDGTGVDISEYIGTIKVSVSVNAVSGTTPTLDGKIQDSPDDSTWADVSGATITQVTTTDSFQEIKVDTRGVDKYIRYVDTAGGTSPVYRRAAIAVGRKQTAV